MLKDRALSCKIRARQAFIFLARFLNEMHFPGKILAKIVLFKKLNFSEITNIKNPFCVSFTDFHFTNYTKFYKEIPIHFLMENFPIFASKSLITSSIAIKLS